MSMPPCECGRPNKPYHEHHHIDHDFDCARGIWLYTKSTKPGMFQSLETLGLWIIALLGAFLVAVALANASAIGPFLEAVHVRETTSPR